MYVLQSVIIPIFNGSHWIDNCFEHIFVQTCIGKLAVEICICDDSSTDNTLELLYKWEKIFSKKNVRLNVFQNSSGKPSGVGYAKNRAVEISTGEYLCFQDVDDVMLPNRILQQYNITKDIGDNHIVGSKFKRIPENSTVRYTSWANNLTNEQLNIQIYTANGPTVIMPTWFLKRAIFDSVGGFSEAGKGTPEDLIFFYKHLDLGGKIYRVNETLLIYNYHMHATTHTIHEDTIWALRMVQLETDKINNWKTFTIWNAGKQGRKFYKSLSSENQSKVIAMCDVDQSKIGRFYTPYDQTRRTNCTPIQIVHFKDTKPPIVICVKMDLTNGEFEENLKSLHMKEGSDYIYFS
ncbi:glycosyltransferase [Holotrichia oblita]|uniref:Glycosyltransferase n=1 Tax=Holotrichia oblita TaxID=644536 RepID=A0ACB9TTV3_HOLOL|nr:glycosyltransferase [Holotrichia oblita]